MIEVEEGAGETKVFEVEQMSLFYSREHGYYLQYPQMKRLRNSIVVEQSIFLT